MAVLTYIIKGWEVKGKIETGQRGGTCPLAFQQMVKPS